MTDLDYSTRYDLMKSDQVPADQLAEWLKEPGFAAYVEGRNASMAARQAGVNAPAPSADAVIAAGSAMANILYNLKQTTIGDERLRASMKKCQEDWDKARSLATIPAAEPVALPDDNRIRDLMKDIGQEHSLSLYQAFKQIIMETRLALGDTAWPASPQPARETEAARDVPAKPDGEDDQFFTLVFAGNIKDAPGNPFKLMTPYGLPCGVGVGHAFRQLDRAEAALRAGEQP